MTASRISGADEPSAISDRFATVGFHTRTVTVSSCRVTPSRRVCVRSREVMTSMAAMKMSATMATPRKQKSKPNMYRICSVLRSHSRSPGTRMKESQNLTPAGSSSTM